MFRLSTEKRIIAIIFGLVAFAALLTFAVIVPTITRIKTIDRETYELRASLERKLKQSTDVRLSIQQLDRIKDDAATLPDHVFHAGNELGLIKLLENMATASGVIERIESSNLDNITGNRISVSLSISGSLANCLTYLKNLESAPYFLTINRFYLTNRSDNSRHGESITLMNLDVSLYVAP